MKDSSRKSGKIGRVKVVVELGEARREDLRKANKRQLTSACRTDGRLTPVRAGSR